MTVFYAGLDVSLELTNICIVDEYGRLVHESRVGSDPELITTELQRMTSQMDIKPAPTPDRSRCHRQLC